MAWPTDASRQRTRSGLILWLTAGVFLLLLGWTHRSDAWTLPWGTSVHLLAETIFLAESAALFGIGWFAVDTPHRLGPTLAATFGCSMALFSLLHLLASPGMPLPFGHNNPDLPFYFGHLARLALPLVLLSLISTGPEDTASATLRTELFVAMLGAVLILAGLPLMQPRPTLQHPDNSATLLKIGVQWGIGGLNALVALLCALRQRQGRLDDWRLCIAAVLAGTSEIALIEADTTGWLHAIGHVNEDLALGLAVLSLHDAGVLRPWRELQTLHTDARSEKERADAVLRSIVDGVIVLDSHLRVIAINPVASHLVGVSSLNAKGMALNDVLGDIGRMTDTSIPRDVTTALREGLALPPPREPLIYTRSGAAYAIEHAVSPLIRHNGHIDGAVLVLRDVTDRWRLQQQLLDSANYVRDLFDSGVDPMMAVGQDGLVMNANKATEKMTGRAYQRLVGSDFASICEEAENAQDALEKVFSEGAVRDLPLHILGAHGERTEVLCSITPCRNSSGSLWGAFVVARDVTDLRTYQSYLEYQATSDALTTLPNRRLFRERIAQALVKCRRTGLLGAVMFIDLDNFKDINDTLGHAAGDELLKQIALRLSESLRETDTVARIGGDEFAVLAEDIGGAVDVQHLAEKLLKIVTVPTIIDSREILVSCSIGVTLFPLDPGDADALLRNADTAMYRAKEEGKNNFQYFTDDMNLAVQRRVEIGHRLRNAIAQRELVAVFQPRVDLASGTIIGAEALLRWNSPELGQVPPLEFIPVAEHTGLILGIGEWILRTACEEAVRWHAGTGHDLVVAVNLSARQLHNNDIVSTVIRILRETGLPAHRLELELTESMLMRDTDRVIETLSLLKQTGIRIAIDDFGTGYSSLSYLKRLPIDHLKIDRSFVTDIPGDANSEAIVRTVIALARGLGLRVVAEGVETATQLAFLRAQGCDEAQGYHIGRPVPVQDLLDRLHHTQQAVPLTHQ